ncbi:fibronectin type III domain-containing protein [Sabulibacter ruber]|uniref:fibronectin type III domain-containing protein n=1 Tax=Sabulibacter ruber TaxID=2811901 RepID=UPI001A96847E|nr:fibronectin type III domain-containing protein [Sabulibacter ruber]
MRNCIFYLSILGLLLCYSCKDDDILTSKPGEPIAPVTNLKHTITDNNVTLTWDLPANYPSDIIQPISVLVIKWEDGRSLGSQVLPDAPETVSFPYSTGKKYKYTVKVQGAVNSEDPYVSKLRISPGQTISF